MTMAELRSAYKAIDKGIYDTKKYRYIAKSENDGYSIYRKPIAELDRLTDWIILAKGVRK